jgi:nitrogen fixation NifU-like protein
MYSKKVVEHFEHPHNMGELKNADGIGKVGNPVCGDVMYIYIKVKNDRVAEIKFKTRGLADAMKITRENVAKSLGGLPPIKMHCSNLAADGLREAIKDYLKKQGKKKK